MISKLLLKSFTGLLALLRRGCKFVADSNSRAIGKNLHDIYEIQQRSCDRISRIEVNNMDLERDLAVASRLDKSIDRILG